MARPQRASPQPLGSRQRRRPARDLGEIPNHIVLTATRLQFIIGIDSFSGLPRTCTASPGSLRELRGNLDRSWHVCKRQAALN